MSLGSKLGLSLATIALVAGSTYYYGYKQGTRDGGEEVRRALHNLALGEICYMKTLDYIKEESERGRYLSNFKDGESARLYQLIEWTSSDIETIIKNSRSPRSWRTWNNLPIELED